MSFNANNNNNNNNNATANADAFVAALLQQQQQQPPLAGRAQQALFPQAGAATNGLAGSGVVQARQTAGRGRGASQLQQRQPLQLQQQAAFGTQQNGALGGSLGLAQQQQPAAAGRGRSAAGRGRATTRQQTLQTRPVGAPAIPLAQQFAAEGGLTTQGTDQQALAALFGTAPANGAVSQQQRQQAAPRRTRALAAANGSLLDNQQQLQQAAPRRARSTSVAASANALGNNNAFGAPNNNNAAAGFGLGGASFGNQFQNQSQDQQQQAASRRARSAGANINAFGSNLPNQFAAQNNSGADNRVASNKKKYILVNGKGDRLGPEFYSTTANGAARKAARNNSDIYLWDPNYPASEGGRVYSYAGRMEPITNPSAHTLKYNINMKPMVESRGFVDLNRNGDVIQPQQGLRSAF
ncbi:hypothetical protein pqer_cds_332 [Pandoravirus quercus]|uniref:Uncharacterized protein n=1 Tax=Pandoravirus quercus TaxID=2107709 RepID=A0A2U7U8J5_9VIRU|nr:hypothetical protein pqer_cds_332 [Pandoravirus quercus]AVK74754.1 hypothetical protein pqer_cds_332 [Pandoravirus quercus]